MSVSPRGHALVTPINFALQSSLQTDSEHRRRQNLCLGAYIGLSTAATAFACVLPAAGPAPAAVLGAIFPGAGFLHWAAGDQTGWALALFAAALIAFVLSLVVWLGTGNVFAPPATWAAAAWLATEPGVLGLNGAQAAGPWPLAIGPTISALLLALWLRPLPRRSSPTFCPAVPIGAAPRPAECEEPSREDLMRMRLLLDRALQPAERFDGFERRDQFQTAALRYQVNFMGYALALAGRHHAPAAQAPFGEAQARLLTKLGDRRLWRYWQLENAWGNLRPGADPVARQNIMYSGFGLLQTALGGGDDLVLHDRGREWRRYGMGEIAGLIEDQYRASRYGLLSCEPHWIYPLCNLITMAGIKAADGRLGTRRWEGLADSFLASLEREGTTRNGDFIAFRSALTGFAPPAPGGIVMQAFPCLFLNALSPERAQAHWHRVRRQLDTQSWRRLFWPIDTGNYGFSRASSYAATAAAAVEMGDRAAADECLRRLEAECPSEDVGGAIHRRNASLWAHALETMARSGRKDGLRHAVAGAPAAAGPRLIRISCPKGLIARAKADGGGIDLVFQPGGGEPRPAIELGGLRPGAHYTTGLPRWPLLKADHEGRGVLRITLGARTALSIRPFASEECRWSAA